jgi:hypothetical protein
MGTLLKQKDMQLVAFTTWWTWLNYTLSIEKFDSYVSDQIFLIKFHQTNSASATVNINSLWAKNIIANAWELLAWKTYLVCYNWVEFVIIWWGSTEIFSSVSWFDEELVWPWSEKTLTNIPVSKESIFVFKKDSWLMQFETVDYTYDTLTNKVTLVTAIGAWETIYIRYMVKEWANNPWLLPTQITSNMTGIYTWIATEPRQVFRNGLYQAKTLDRTYVWTTLTFINPTTTTDIIIFIY